MKFILICPLRKFPSQKRIAIRRVMKRTFVEVSRGMVIYRLDGIRKKMHRVVDKFFDTQIARMNERLAASKANREAWLRRRAERRERERMENWGDGLDGNANPLKDPEGIEIGGSGGGVR